MNKQKSRQTIRHKSKYERQFARTAANKAKNILKHNTARK